MGTGQPRQQWCGEGERPPGRRLTRGVSAPAPALLGTASSRRQPSCERPARGMSSQTLAPLIRRGGGGRWATDGDQRWWCDWPRHRSPPRTPRLRPRLQPCHNVWSARIHLIESKMRQLRPKTPSGQRLTVVPARTSVRLFARLPTHSPLSSNAMTKSPFSTSLAPSRPCASFHLPSRRSSPGHLVATPGFLVCRRRRRPHL